MKPVLVLLCVLLPLASACDVFQQSKVFLFAEKSKSSYVTLATKKPLDLKAVTLCMRIAPQLDSNRETVFFSYHHKNTDELNVWGTPNGKVNLEMKSGTGFLRFTLPPFSAFHTHLCLTWASSTGLVTFWVDGRRGATQVYKQGHRVQSGGVVLLGQDADNTESDFDINQSFVGEITDVNMWDYVLTGSQIRQLYQRQGAGLVPKGNVIDWSSLQYKAYGKVIEMEDVLV